MPFQPEAPPRSNPIQELIDLANTKAFQRGKKDPTWLDVWDAMCATPAYARVMQERGVRTSGLSADIEFISKIGPKQDSAIFAPDNVQFDASESLSTARKDLADHLQSSFKEFGVNLSEPEKQKFDQFIKHVMGKLVFDTSKDEMPEQKALKLQVLQQAIAETLMGGGVIALGERGGKPDPLTAIKISQLAQQVANVLFRDEVEAMARPGDDVIAFLEDIKAQSILEPLSPNKLFESLLLLSGPVYNKLLLRNGYFSTDEAVQTDELAPLFPNDFMRDLSLDAINVAYRTQSKEVTKKHLIAALLENQHVMVNLSKLGMKDYQKFVEKYHEKAFGKQDEDEGRKIRVHPKLTPEFKDLIWQFNEKIKEWDDEVRGPELLCQTFHEDKESDKLLNESGLLRRMQRSWRSAYDENWSLKKSEKDPGKKEKKKAEEFKVSDEALKEMIETYCVDYVALAKKKKFDPMVGREQEMEEIITTLLKRGKKNPVVVGEAGIGKSKFLEGIAQRIVKGEVPAKMVGARLLSVDMTAMGSMWAGVFEERLKTLLQGVSERNASGRFPPIMLGIDELAAQQNAGAHSKGDGAKDVIKPYLTSGDLFVIANTTKKEFQRDVQKDPALARRFNEVSIEAPSVADTIKILLQNKQKYARHHGIRIPDAMVKQIVELADRYVSTNQPDKSIDMLDYACAIAVRNNARSLEPAHAIKACSRMGNISEEFLSQNDRRRYRDLPKNLKKEILQQDKAVDAITAPLQRSRFGLREKGRPLGNFLFVGPSGVGKTELTKALARHLYGDDKEGKTVLRYDMSEYMEKHSVSKFIGSPPGYVGNEEGGKLINDVNAHPFSIVLYDEIEKAHEDITKALLGPFGNGKLTDGLGRTADFKNTINVMTSNLGNQQVIEMGKRMKLDPVKDYAAWQKMARPIYEAAVKAHFSTEFLGRLDGVIYFDSLTGETIELLTDRRLEQTKQQLRENNNGLEIELGEHFRRAVINEGFNPLYGARPLANAVKNMVETPLARHLLELSERKLARVKSVFIEVAEDWTPPSPDEISAGAVYPDFTLTMQEKKLKSPASPASTPPASAGPAPVNQP